MEGDFRVGDWLVRPDLNRIEREGEEKSIEPKVMDVLVYLASTPSKSNCCGTNDRWFADQKDPTAVFCGYDS